MSQLNPNKLHVDFSEGISVDRLTLPRTYTLTHSDSTGALFLTIAQHYDLAQISGWYTRLMRDEVLAEWIVDEDGPALHVYCHVSGGFVFGTAKWRYNIFQSELPLVLEAIRYGDRTLFKYNPELDNSLIFIYFHSTNSKFDKVENWGTMLKYI